MTNIPKYIRKKESEMDWWDRHFWWCFIWQLWHKREPNDYDGVCMNCEKDRYTGKKV